MNDYNHLEHEPAHQRELAADPRDGSSPVAGEPLSDDDVEVQDDDKLQVTVEGNPLGVAVRAWPLAPALAPFLLALAPFVLLAVAFHWLYLKLASSARQDAIDQDAERRR